jgi:hypothetical protein
MLFSVSFAALVLLVPSATAGDFIPGDVNDDGIFDVLDSTVLRRALAGLGPGMTQGCISELPATGQTTAATADKNDGIPGPVAVLDDGTIQAGSPLAYADNADGTITDLNTGLMWEKKGNDGGLHDKDNAYVWSFDGSTETIWDWLDDVNAEASMGFAGYSDWRIPNARELQSIIDHERAVPSVDPVFDTSCPEGCMVTGCSCTAAAAHWSSTTDALNETFAWNVHFFGGQLGSSGKGSLLRVRAVRGGL